MRRLTLWLFLSILAGANAAPNSQALRDFPSDAKIDHRVQLSPQERDQIVRLIASKTSQRIHGVWWDGPDKILVSCGYNDLVQGKHPLRGDGFILQRTKSKWKIIEQPNWVDISLT
jgi:hypothetical protein